MQRFIKSTKRVFVWDFRSNEYFSFGGFSMQRKRICFGMGNNFKLPTRPQFELKNVFLIFKTVPL